jgi:hypothetical protein
MTFFLPAIRRPALRQIYDTSSVLVISFIQLLVSLRLVSFTISYFIPACLVYALSPTFAADNDSMKAIGKMFV